MKELVYLDYASGTPVDKWVLAAMEPYLSQKFYNPAANYALGRQAKADFIAAKKRIAGHLGVVHSELIMTSGGSESNNLAISGVMDKFPGKKILVSGIEHESVLRPAEQYEHSLLKVDENGLVNIGELENDIEDNVVLLSVMLANNEIGTIQPISKIAAKLREIRRDRQTRGVDLPLYFHSDACQAPLQIDVNPHRLGVDLLSLNGGKIYGPKQTGLLFASKNIVLQPQILGGGQQRGIRSGSQSPAHAVGLAVALDLAAKNRPQENKRLSDLQNYFTCELKKLNPKIVINGSRKDRLVSNVHATFPGADNERLLFQLDEVGIMASAGSACSAADAMSSHVLSAIGLSEKAARSSIRFSMGRETSKSDIDFTSKTLKKYLA